MSSLASRASSWDFSATPSLPSSPIRTSLLPSAVRSPSIMSQMQDYFPSLPSRSHSRSSSRIPSLPPSPRVSLKQWAERTASEGMEDAVPKRQSGIEMGKRTSAPLRRGQSVSFDDSLDRGSNSPKVGRKARRLPSIDGGMTMSPLIESLGSSPPTARQMNDFDFESSMGQIDMRDDRSVFASPEMVDLTHSSEGHEGSTTAPAMSRAMKTVSPASTRVAEDQSSPKASSEVPISGRGRSGTIMSLSTPMAGRSPEKDKDKDRGRKGWLARRVSIKNDREEGVEKEKSEAGWAGGLTRRLTAKRNRG